MTSDASPLRLAELPWTRVADVLRRDPRLLVPVGTTLQHGPHLPLGTDTLVVTRLAEALSARYGVLVAPALPYGAGSPVDQEYAGSACLRGKTLHRTLNELVATWEEQGVEEFVLLTVHGYGPHLQALASVTSESARIRAVDVHALDLSRFLEGLQWGEHAGELATSLLLHLAPELVREEEVVDAPLPPEEVDRLTTGEEPSARPGGPGVVGHPSRANAEKGKRIFEYLVDRIGGKVLSDPESEGGGTQPGDADTDGPPPAEERRAG